jgi:hypothetical protein
VAIVSSESRNCRGGVGPVVFGVVMVLPSIVTV